MTHRLISKCTCTLAAEHVANGDNRAGASLRANPPHSQKGYTCHRLKLKLSAGDAPPFPALKRSPNSLNARPHVNLLGSRHGLESILLPMTNTSRLCGTSRRLESSSIPISSLRALNALALTCNTERVPSQSTCTSKVGWCEWSKPCQLLPQESQWHSIVNSKNELARRSDGLGSTSLQRFIPRP